MNLSNITSTSCKFSWSPEIKVSDKTAQTSISDKFPSCINQKILSYLSIKEVVDLGLVSKKMKTIAETVIIKRANSLGIEYSSFNSKENKLENAKSYIKNIFQETKTCNKIISKKYVYIKDKILFEPEKILRNIENLSDEKFFELVLKAIPVKVDKRGALESFRSIANKNGNKVNDVERATIYDNSQRYLFCFLCKIATFLLKENKLNIVGRIKESVNKEKNTFLTVRTDWYEFTCGILEDLFIDRLRLLLIMGVDPNFTLPLEVAISSIVTRTSFKKPTSFIEESALSIAIYLKQQQVVQLLLDWGANPNKIAEDQTPPLGVAIAMNECWVGLLLDKGADPRNSGLCSIRPRNLAAAYASIEIFKMILNHDKDDINAVDKNGSTVLMFAAKHCWGDIRHNNKRKIRYLIDNKADINIINNENRKAIDCYEERELNEYRDPQVLKFLTPPESKN